MKFRAFKGGTYVSAYFTIYAYEQLKEKLQRIDHLNFLFREPCFVKSLNEYAALIDRFRKTLEDKKLAIHLGRV